jgi:hypothetical protein
MPGGGTVRFETRNVTLSAQYLGNVPETPPGDYVLLAIANNPARPFDPAEIGKARAFALDLGWMPPYMRRMNGMARIFNVEGHGTTVRLYFPAARPRPDGDVSWWSTTTRRCASRRSISCAAWATS